ncbi:MAG: thioredoxin domain-containing protein [Pseudomonadota bacterium]|nr:thioredoxin domain-containing protein [Pseudomonadota bacterium]
MVQIDKNVLSEDLSPYLKQHKDNPVNWQTWSKEILEFAKQNKKPILLSIGYASCHWCHVMAHESFEDSETANVMNKFFVNIKVDREERPDLDFIFQSSFQLFNQTGGGWPLTMFLDENGVPFMGGTYFPKESKHGLPSFKEVLQKVSDAYKDQRENIINQKSLIIKNLGLKKNSVLNQELEPILDISLNNLDKVKGGYKGAPKFPTFNLYETLLYFFNKSGDKKYLEPVELIIKQLCSKGIYDHVEGGIARYTVDEDWVVPHFEKMLYDNAQFILLLSKYCKINSQIYFKEKLEQTINFLFKNFINKEGFLGSAYDADSDGVEGKYYVFSYDEIKGIENIEKYFEIKPEGNWENKIILIEKEKPNENILNKLLKIRLKRAKPLFDDKTQLDLNCLMISALVKASEVLPEKNYLKLAEEFFTKIEKKYIKKKIYHSFSENIVFIEDYAFLINSLNDLYDKTLNFKYKDLAKKKISEAINKFYLIDKDIFQKNPKTNKDIFFNPIDIGDSTIPNGNAIMLINLIRLGMMDEAKKLSESLNGYLNVYKNHMMTSLRALDFFNNIKSGKNCNDQGCNL